MVSSHSFNLDFLSISQEIVWEEYLRYDLFGVSQVGCWTWTQSI